ncbi:MAG: methyl-accepting chemotaxis protein, partial [Geopsychrobacter sp.]|nr:methyl-accepting chemotaxis protein [Geopsychrobacter sp.]
ELMADIKPLQENSELINAVYFSQLTGDTTRLEPILKKLKQDYDLERIELLNQSGLLYTLSKGQDSLETETLTEEEQENLSQALEADANNHFQLIRGDLTLTAGVPISLQGQVIARLNGFRVFTDATANHLHTLIGTEIAFHNGNRIVATSNQQLAQLDLTQILNHQLQKVVSNNIPYALFPSSLPDDQGGFYLAIDRAAAQRAQSTMQQTLLIVLIAVFFLAAAVAVIVSRGITTPLQQVVGNLHQIADGAGDLTRTLPITSGDEVGALAKSFNRLMASLREMIMHIRTATQKVGDAARQIGDRSVEMNNDASEQSKALEKSHLAIKKMSGMAGEIADNVSSLVASVQESAAATQEFGSTTTGISEQMENLFAITSEISSSIHQLSSSNQQIEGNVSALSQNTQETAESIRQMDEATRAIDDGAKETQQLVVQAAEESLEGKAAVMDTIRGISGLQQTIEQAHHSIRELGNRSDAIGNIITVIAEIADQTNLLALNAAIIAAQAGEHGKGFAVVANEIRSLAERTSISTDEITGIVESLQEGTRMAANAIEAGSIKAEQEVARSQTAGEALEKLHKSAVTSTTQVKKITELARHQTEASHIITQAVINITDTLQQVASSISQQGSSTRHLANAAEQMTGISARVKNSTNEQKRGSQQIAMAMELIQETIEKIHSATLQQNESSQQAMQVVAQAAEIAENNAQRSDQFNQIVKTLSAQTKSLQKNIGTFKI